MKISPVWFWLLNYSHTPKTSIPMQRIDRILSARTSLDRTTIKDLIRRKVVSIKSNGKIVAKSTEKFAVDSTFLINGKTSSPPPLLVVFNKPLGVLSIVSEKTTRPNLSFYLPPPISDVPYNPSLFHPVGRLDNDSSGLLLFSSSGPLTQKLLHPKFNTEKQYKVTVENKLDIDVVKKQLSEGVDTKMSGSHIAAVAEFSESENSISLIVAEGKYRMVRRMLANIGHPVLSLSRTRIGEIVMDDSDPPPGKFRLLTEAELEWVVNK